MPSADGDFNYLLVSSSKEERSLAIAAAVLTGD